MTWVIGLGASLGDRRRALRLGIAALAATPGLRVVALSRLWRSPPMGGVARGAFLNAAVSVAWSGEPTALLERTRAIERQLGRRAGPRWGDRPLDLDLLWAGDLVLDTPSLVLPHPGLFQRNFALVPLLEVAEKAWDPRTKTPLSALPAASRVGLCPAGVLSLSLRSIDQRCIGEPFPPR